MHAVVPGQHLHVLHADIGTVEKRVRPVGAVFHRVAAQGHVPAAVKVEGVRAAVVLLTQLVKAVPAVDAGAFLADDGDVVRVDGANQSSIPSAARMSEERAVRVRLKTGGGPGRIAAVSLGQGLQLVGEQMAVVLGIAAAQQVRAAQQMQRHARAQAQIARQIVARRHLDCTAALQKALVNTALNGASLQLVQTRASAEIQYGKGFLHGQ